MSMNGVPLRSKPSHPGHFIKNVLLQNYGMSLDTLSKRADIDRHDLEDIINEKANMTEHIASRLKPVFGPAADRLLKLQAVYDFYRKNGRRPTSAEATEPPRPMFR